MSKLVSTIDILSYSAELLKGKGFKDARLNAEMLLSDVMKCDRIHLYLNFDKPMNDTEKTLFKNHLKRRLNGEPVQYILGKTYFYGLSILVSDEVMIPRPDTEILVEQVLNAVNREKAHNLNILEIGCGSGCVSLAIANELKKTGLNFNIESIDISSKAVEIAKKNQLNIGIAEKYLKFNVTDIFKLESFDGYDYVVSNPPYISLKDFSGLENEVKNFEPEISLTDGEDGFRMFRRICSLKKISANKPRVFCEIGYGQKENISNIISEFGFNECKYHKDFNEIFRVVEFE